MFFQMGSTSALVLLVNVVVVDLVDLGGCWEAEDADEDGALRFLLLMVTLGMGLVGVVVFTKVVVMTFSFLSALSLLVVPLFLLFMWELFNIEVNRTIQDTNVFQSVLKRSRNYHELFV
jgi:hypothetical protein